MLKNTEPDSRPKKELKRIALFLDTLLKIELIKGLVYPGYLQKVYTELDDVGANFLKKLAQSQSVAQPEVLPQTKKEWHKYTFDKIFLLACAETRNELGRELYKSEAGLIEQRVNEFLKKSGFDNGKTD